MVFNLGSSQSEKPIEIVNKGNTLNAIYMRVTHKLPKFSPSILHKTESSTPFYKTLQIYSELQKYIDQNPNRDRDERWLAVFIAAN